MRTDNVFKQAYNGLLDQIKNDGPSAVLPSERELARRLGVSRTTTRRCIASLRQSSIVADGGPLARIRMPDKSDYFPEAETTNASALVEREFLKWILHTDSRPGQHINASRLAREFGTSTTSIREFLQSFQHFGLLDRRPNSSWVFKGMTLEFANELSDIREIFELRSALSFARLPPQAAAWEELERLRKEHLVLLNNIDTNYSAFSYLDEKLHRLINDGSSNRFVTEFYQVISLIFFYHYQWNKRDERERNEAAVHQHLDYIDALFSRDEGRIRDKCSRHLASARTTLIQSIDLTYIDAQQFIT